MFGETTIFSLRENSCHTLGSSTGFLSEGNVETYQSRSNASEEERRTVARGEPPVNERSRDHRQHQSKQLCVRRHVRARRRRSNLLSRVVNKPLGGLVRRRRGQVLALQADEDEVGHFVACLSELGLGELPEEEEGGEGEDEGGDEDELEAGWHR